MQPNRIQKAEIVLLTEHLQRNPTYEKGKERPLPAQGTPLANLTTINLSRKKSGNFRPNVCGKYALQGSSRALYTPLDPTHKECTWPVPFQEAGYAVLIGSWVVKDGVLWSGGVIWTGGLDWRWWCDLWWSNLVVGTGRDDGLLWYSDVVVWSGLWSNCIVWCSDRLVSWSNLEVCLRKMVWSDGWKLKR